jgi:hypothetical protein
MESCPHISCLNFSQVRKVVAAPHNWQCEECGTTQDTWLCLSCGHVGCGRRVKKHAHAHYTQRGHVLVLEVNSHSVHCYACDEWVLKDTPHGDLRLLRQVLTEVQDQMFGVSTTRRGTVLRPAQPMSQCSPAFVRDAREMTDKDKIFTAVKFHNTNLLAKCIARWKRRVRNKHVGDEEGGVKSEPKSEPAFPSKSSKASGGVASPSDLIKALYSSPTRVPLEFHSSPSRVPLESHSSPSRVSLVTLKAH